MLTFLAEWTEILLLTPLHQAVKAEDVQTILGRTAILVGDICPANYTLRSFIVANFFELCDTRVSFSAAETVDG